MELEWDEVLQPVIIIASALFGLLLGYISSFGDISVHLIEPFLMVLLYFVFLSADGKKLKKAFLNIKFTATAVFFNFIWTPVFAFGLGKLFFYHNIDMQIGLMMLMVTPCTDWYLVLTALAKGNVELGASILPLNLLLQIVLMPVYLLIFYGGRINILAGDVLLDVFIVLVIPFTLSFITKRLENRNDKLKNIVEKIRDFDEKAEIIFLCLAVISMFASESKSLFDNPLMFLRMLVPMILFFIVNFIVVRFIGTKLKFNSYDLIPLNFTTLARNSPLSLAIAVAAFPDRPTISLALVIGPLIELPSLLFIVFIILNINKRKNKAKSSSEDLPAEAEENQREVNIDSSKEEGEENQKSATTDEKVEKENLERENYVSVDISNFKKE